MDDEINAGNRSGWIGFAGSSLTEQYSLFSFSFSNLIREWGKQGTHKEVDPV
jgi:hypothetical protein